MTLAQLVPSANAPCTSTIFFTGGGSCDWARVRPESTVAPATIAASTVLTMFCIIYPSPNWLLLASVFDFQNTRGLAHDRTQRQVVIRLSIAMGSTRIPTPGAAITNEDQQSVIAV